MTENLQACIAIKTRMSQQIVEKVDHFATAYEIWDFTKVYFEGYEKTKLAKFFVELIATKDDYTDESTLVSVLTRLRESLNKSTINSDEVIRYFLLRALPDPFDSVKAIIENSSTSTLTGNFQSVIKAGRKMRDESGKSVLAAQTMRRNQLTNSQSKTQPKNIHPPCEHCGQMGHPPWRCRDRPRNKKSEEDKNHKKADVANSKPNRNLQVETKKSTLSCFGAMSIDTSDESDSEESNLGCIRNFFPPKGMIAQISKV